MNHFELKIVNGIAGDPAVYVFFPGSGEAVLFDLGNLDSLSNRELLKVRFACVSHCHIDHFIDFDRLLRINIPHFRVVELAGPKGFIRNVEGRLRGYLWNLLEPGQITFVAHELHEDGSLTSAKLTNDNDFTPEILSTKPARPGEATPVYRFSDGSLISAIAVDHGTPSIAYRYEPPLRFHVKSEELERLGLKAGPWIRDLQSAMHHGSDEETIEIAGKEYQAKELAAKVMEAARPHSISYLTDAVFSAENLTRLKSLMAGTRLLVCEACFRDQDRDRARQKKHLTTRQAALVAAHVGAEELEIFHVSGIYGDSPEDSQQEAAKFWEDFRKLDRAKLAQEVARELALMADA